MLSTTEETQNYRRAFHSYFYNNILKNLQKFERKRKSALVKYQLLIGLSVLVMGIALIVGFSNILKTVNDQKAILEIGFFISMVIVTAAYKYKKSFEKEVKKGVINSFLSFFGDFHWSMDEHIPEEDIEYSKLITKFTRLESDDYFEGVHDGVKITISEMKLINKDNFGTVVDTLHDPSEFYENKRDNEITVFRGLFIKLSLNKLLNSHTIIIENTSAVDKFFSALSKERSGMEKVELEDVEFNKQFSVFSEDQTEARYILTTTFMERFKHLKDIFQTNNIKASFQTNAVLIAIESYKDLFVLGDVTRPVTDTQQVQTLFEEFAAVLSLIEVLKLNMKLGL